MARLQLSIEISPGEQQGCQGDQGKCTGREHLEAGTLALRAQAQDQQRPMHSAKRAEQERQRDRQPRIDPCRDESGRMEKHVPRPFGSPHLQGATKNRQNAGATTYSRTT